METMRWQDDCLVLLDQTLLPGEVRYIQCRDVDTVCAAIRRLAVRGAPAIGAAAAYGLALGARSLDCADSQSFLSRVREIADRLAATRPTAVNLHWALRRLLDKMTAALPATPQQLKELLLAEARAIYDEDYRANQAMGRHGAELLPEQAGVLTHCNAGALATAGFGTALGVIRAAHQQGKKIHVYADETRPLLQGARLTTWELLQEGIPVTLLTDNMAGYLMALGKVDAVIVGADRITRNGDVANKIGTYSVAVLAREHGIPFYVAAPLSTIDLSLASGQEIPIEQRAPEEVTCIGGVRVAPAGVEVWNPAFDVTPARLVTAIITERGVYRPPYTETLPALFAQDC
ncbi:MAG: S-methyl-5-thioribose-1-phosphate isomerase [Desulfurispora sp.]|uniref:S-methyl-5-thioribose-1-phosphate isomerase n=1 Tax=Desulfurispora sp. TaxID=3014275 RepID=UPI00404B440F